ncbi:MAG: hypothetical protein ACR2P0_03115 [Acidimicrobiales bacterium]
MTTTPDLAELAARVAAARDDEELRALFQSLVDEYGRTEASRLWWQVFGAVDASET